MKRLRKIFAIAPLCRILFCLLVAVLCLASCKKEDKVIPRKTMSQIYADMFVADQRITGSSSPIRAAADTSFVYEPIFEKYGYTSDDYRASVAYYIKDANRFARILRATGTILEGEIRELKKQKEQEALAVDANYKIRQYMPKKIYYMTSLKNTRVFGPDTLRFFLDTTGGAAMFDATAWDEIRYNGPEIVHDATNSRRNYSPIRNAGPAGSSSGTISTENKGRGTARPAGNAGQTAIEASEEAPSGNNKPTSGRKNRKNRSSGEISDETPAQSAGRAAQEPTDKNAGGKTKPAKEKPARVKNQKTPTIAPPDSSVTAPVRRLKTSHTSSDQSSTGDGDEGKTQTADTTSLRIKTR